MTTSKTLLLFVFAVTTFVMGCESMGVNPDASIGPPGREARGGGIFTGEDGRFTGEIENDAERETREAATGANDDDYQAWRLEQESTEYEAWKGSKEQDEFTQWKAEREASERAEFEAWKAEQANQ
jgi:hypothetical protein